MEASGNDILGMIGLELAMPLCKLNHIKNYWSTESFGNGTDFRKTVSRNRFLKLHANIRFYGERMGDETINNNMILEDPLYFVRPILDEFNIRSRAIAVPVGAAAYDENGKATKARCSAKSYLPNKRAKYAIRFYASCGSTFAYCFSLVDNDRGNKSKVLPAQRYVMKHTELRKSYHNFCSNNIKFDKTKPNALWVVMMAHATKTKDITTIEGAGKKRWYFTDNFYTRHTLAQDLKKYSGGEAHLIGTCKINIMDAANITNIKEAVRISAKYSIKRGE